MGSVKAADTAAAGGAVLGGRREGEAGNGLRRGVGLGGGGGAGVGLPLFVYAWVGSYSRYTADDYCWAGILRTEGFLNAQVLWYTVYSPRYAFTFLVNLVELAGPAIVPALPALAIVVCVAVLTWSLCQFR